MAIRRDMRGSGWGGDGGGRERRKNESQCLDFGFHSWVKGSAIYWEGKTKRGTGLGRSRSCILGTFALKCL